LEFLNLVSKTNIQQRYYRFSLVNSIVIVVVKIIITVVVKTIMVAIKAIITITTIIVVSFMAIITFFISFKVILIIVDFDFVIVSLTIFIYIVGNISFIEVFDSFILFIAIEYSKSVLSPIVIFKVFLRTTLDIELIMILQLLVVCNLKIFDSLPMLN